MGWMENRVVLITGAGSGMGKALLERFLAEGARVGVLEFSADKAAKLQAEFGDQIAVTQGNVASYADNQAAVAATVAAFGKLDTFIGNAGVFDYFQSINDLDGNSISDAFDELFSINVKGYLLGAKAASEELKKTRGSIIFTVSNAGFYPGGGGPIYTASKHAVIGLIKQLGQELAPEVRVNGVAPGGMKTELGGLNATGTGGQTLDSMPGLEEMIENMTPLKIAPKPADYCGPYVLLASAENAGPMTGVTINTDGGLGVVKLFPDGE
ncbi:MAG: 3-(cis-5,6-dihydroxycyclohexa-1,3-dien-1-yl)propanoate dehydrogenase [Immundisolibacteraceae bacterium]|nr:3-(cis-5,6-dihydroxycyclohexa-1,3-dien-1-yl)propanoate dehydrogenase [Immundisolibacteraceae bacterium]